MGRIPITTVRALLFSLAAILFTSKNGQRLRAATIAAVGTLFAADGTAWATIVTTTVKGTILSGYDTGSGTTGVFGPVGDLTGKSFTLVYTFDDTKGQQYSTGDYVTGINSTGSSSPGMAVLTINGVSISIGGAGGGRDPISSESKDINRGSDEISIDVSDSINCYGDSANVYIAPESGNSNWNTSVDWHSPFYFSSPNLWYGTSGFGYGVCYGPHSYVHSAGYFLPSSISVSSSQNLGSPTGTSFCAGSNSGGPGLPPSPVPNAMCGNPINAATGNKLQVESDFIGAPNTGLEFVRYYNNQDVSLAALGAGWRTSWQRALSISANAVIAIGVDGKQFAFTNNNGVYSADPNVGSVLQAIISGSAIVGYQLTTASDDIETYSASGQLLNVKTRAGLTTTLGYDGSGNLVTVTGPFGHTLRFAVDSSQRIASMTVPNGGIYVYGYDGYGNIVSVTHPDNSVRRYVYENASLPNFLTGVIDENGARFATWAYDNQGHAISSQHAGGVELTKVAYGINTSTVTDANGAVHTYNFATLFNVVKPVSQTGVPVPALGGKAFAYDANGFLASFTDYNGNVTTYAHNTRGDETSRKLASGTSIAHTISTTWHPNFHLPTQIVDGDRTTTLNYDTNGNLTSKTVVAPGTNSAWSYTYNAAGQVLTATDPRGYVTFYGYDSKGDLTSIRNALGQVTNFTSFDAVGRPLSMTDPNGLATALTYNWRGQVTSRVVGAWTTTYAYDPVGQLTKLTRPDGSYLSFTYDAAHRLTGIADPLGNRIAYTLDASSNVVKTQVFNAANVQAQTHWFTYDAVNRLFKSIGARGQVTQSIHDLNGNLTRFIDPLGDTTTNRFDALNRFVQSIDPTNGVTGLGYDPHDRLAHLRDPRALDTYYRFNGLDEATVTISPDTGTTLNAYDTAGNVAASTDARGNKTVFAYDALNRRTLAKYADGSFAAYGYDQGANGIGHLTSMRDGTGTTRWYYNINGQVIVKTQATGAVTLSTTYSYDAAGRLRAMKYPSGARIIYGYNANGQIAAMSYQPAGSSTAEALLGGIAYQPFGPVRSWRMGSGAAYARVFDLDGRITGLSLPANDNIALTYDAAGRITSMTETGLAAKTFGYDALNRLKSYAHGTQSQTFAYDADGNRVGSVVTTAAGSNTLTYGYDTKSNRLLSITTGTINEAFGYDASGNTISDQNIATNFAFAYDAKNRLASATDAPLSLAYGINGLGQRTSKANTSTGSATEVSISLVSEPAQTLFLYDEAGHLAGQYDGTGAPQQETVWLGDLPVATIQNGSANYIAPDHLGAPHQITNGAQAVVWFWDHDPFGSGAPTGDITYSPRFPGQFYDTLTGLNYNGFRDYNPGTGRYIESDPIGLAAGVNTYGYVGGNPVWAADPEGSFIQIAVAAAFIFAYDLYPQPANAPGLNEITYPENPYGPLIFGLTAAFTEGAATALGRGGQCIAAKNIPTWTLGEGKSAAKWASQMEQRGWSSSQIDEALASDIKYSAPNNLNPANGATRYVHPETGRSVVIDNETGQLIHVGGDGFKY